MLTVLDAFDVHQPFPDVSEAFDEPNGLLAVGGCLSPVRLQNAYRCGIFPWFSDGDPILWWSPDPRMVLLPDELKISRSLRKTLRKVAFRYSYDCNFSGVLAACAAPRRDSKGTWITVEMMSAYRELHRMGMAHSFEVWLHHQLVGGLYGVAVGRVFYGESMFHRVDDASKAALVYAVDCLKRWNFELIDCKLHTTHLASLGANEISRRDYIDLLRRYCNQPVDSSAWSTEQLS